MRNTESTFPALCSHVAWLVKQFGALQVERAVRVAREDRDASRVEEAAKEKAECDRA